MVSRLNENLKNAAPETIALIKQHETMRTKKSYDPFGLGKIAEIYREAPERSHIKQLEGAVSEYSRLKNENQAAQQYLDKLAEQLLSLTKLRKGAVHYDEIAKRTSELKKLIELEIKEINDLNTQVQSFSAIALNYSGQAKLLPTEYQNKINEMQNRLKK